MFGEGVCQPTLGLNIIHYPLSIIHALRDWWVRAQTRLTHPYITAFLVLGLILQNRNHTFNTLAPSAGLLAKIEGSIPVRF